MKGGGPHDANIGDGVNEPLRIDGDVVGDLTHGVLSFGLAGKFQ